MQTYYAQVFDGVDANGYETLPVDLGNSIGEITHPDGVLDAVRDYADIPDNLGTRLAADRAADTSTFAQLRSEAGHTARQALQGDPAAIATLLGRNTASAPDVDAILESHTTQHSTTDTDTSDVGETLDDEDFDDDEDLRSGLGY